MISAGGARIRLTAGFGDRSRRRPRPGAVFGGAVALLLVATAIAGPGLVGVDPAHQDLLGRLAPPLGFGGSSAHPLGTDALGRDVLARLVAGARISLLVGLAATAGAGLIGITLGVLAGWLGGLADAALGWLTDVQTALPFIVVAIATTAALGNGLKPVLLTLILTGWISYARVLRLQTRSLRRVAWVEAAVALGVGPGGLLRRHVVPHLIGTVAILATQQVSAMILYEASLSYLGLGIGGTAITWGGMAAEGQEALLKAPWVTAAPGAAVALVVLGLNLLGDAVAEG